MRKEYDFLVVGSGFSGAVIAERLAEKGKTSLVIDKRDHIGGNCYDEIDSHGVLIHRYGPHAFHTTMKEVFEYLSHFTEWLFYEHRVVAEVDGKLLPIPINQDTINQLYGLNLDEEGVRDFYAKVRESIQKPKNSEEAVINRLGRDLFEKFFKGLVTDT